ncbi:MAG: hypothetical protein H6Q04_2323 [Acidobacteria bacterium]|jgi:hypothetical protein|nr:hypothetical protein [Acidobacteriota bacterium]
MSALERPLRRAVLFIDLLIMPLIQPQVLILKFDVDHSGRALLALLASSTVITSPALNLTKGMHREHDPAGS